MSCCPNHCVVGALGPITAIWFALALVTSWTMISIAIEQFPAPCGGQLHLTRLKCMLSQKNVFNQNFFFLVLDVGKNQNPCLFF